MGLSQEQELLLKKIFVEKVPHPIDSVRAFIEDFMVNFLAKHKNSILKKYLSYLRENAQGNWFEVLLANCPNENACENQQDDFLKKIKQLKKEGKLTDYEIAKQYMQGGAHRLIKDRFIMDAYLYCEKEYKGKDSKKELDTIKKINLVLIRIIFICNSLSGINQMIIKILTGAKDKIKFGTPKKSELAAGALFETPRVENFAKIIAEINADSGLLLNLYPFKIQFDGCIHKKEVLDDRLPSDFWDCKDTIIILIDRLIILLKNYENEMGVDCGATKKSKLIEFIEKMKEFRLFFLNNGDDFSKLYQTLTDIAEKDKRQDHTIVAPILTQKM